MNKNNQTTSTKCQYHEAAPRPKNDDRMRNVFYIIELGRLVRI